MIINRYCANCGADIAYLKATGLSSIYNPGDIDIELCEPCFFEEDALIDEHGNDLPDRLAHYKHMIARLG